MQKRKLQNKDLDAIGRRLIRSGTIREDEIERITDAPTLFAGVAERIASAHSSQRASRPAFAMSIRKNAAVFASVIIATLGLTVFGLYIARRAAEQAAIKDRIPEAIPEHARPDIAPQVIDVNGITKGRAKHQRSVAEKAVRRQLRPPVKRQAREDEHHAEFYALTYAGNPADDARGGKVIRVDLTRSSLFAMGVDLPLENEADIIKADLMVGADGVTRAIRLVE